MKTENKKYFITVSDFEAFLNILGKQGKVYTPSIVSGRRQETPFFSYKRKALEDKFEYFGFRPSQPLKTFLFSGRMKVAEYSGTSVEFHPAEKTIIAGAAACDVESLKSLDAVFLQDNFTDIFYRDKRNSSFIISMDCTHPRETCLCTLAGINPYPESGFDLNLSKITDGYIIETGSKKGEKAVVQNLQFFSTVNDKILNERNENRSEIISKVKNFNKTYLLSKSRREILEINRKSTEWFKHVQTCIECAACLFACPTCHCFLLFDQTTDTPEKFQRVKEWDSCSYAGYSRMAGGSSPRVGIMERFRHRYLHKFEYFPKNFGFEACTGCGRCVEGCMGRIDMRKVLKSMDETPIGVKNQ